MTKRASPKQSLLKRLVFFLSFPLRRYIQYRFRLAIEKDIRLQEIYLQKRKPHWSKKQVQKRARQKYAQELKKIGVI
ncbi:MAG: hypothetical protein ACI9YE_003692 [Psychroserpens sp.]|jgi:hypothetical protein